MWSEFQRQEDLLLQCISLVFKTSRAPSYGHLWQLFIQNIYSFWLAQISWLILLNELAFTKFCSLWYPVYWIKSTVGHRQKRGCLITTCGKWQKISHFLRSRLTKLPENTVTNKTKTSTDENCYLKNIC